MEHLAYEIVLIALVGSLILVEEGIFDNTVAALSTYEEVCILSVAAKSYLAVREEGIELTARFEADLAALKSLPPEAEAVVADRANVICKVEACAVLIAIAEVVPVLPAQIAECDTVGVVIPTGCKAVERMDVAQIVAALEELNADLNACNSHIRKGVVHTLDKQTDRVYSAATNDIYVADIAVSRARVCAPLNVQTDLGVLDGNVLNSGLTSAVDGYAVSDVVTVDDTAREVIVASVYHYSIEGLSRTETDESLITVPAIHSLDDCEVRELKRYCMLGVSGSADRLGEKIFSVGEVKNAAGIVQNELLKSVGYVLTRICLNVIGN